MRSRIILKRRQEHPFTGCFPELNSVFIVNTEKNTTISEIGMVVFLQVRLVILQMLFYIVTNEEVILRHLAPDNI